MSVRLSTDNIIAFLNEILSLDQEAISALINHRVRCNDDLADHETVQVSSNVLGNEVGMLGIINGYCGQVVDDRFKGYGPIAAIMDDKGKVMRFQRTEEAE